MSKRPRIPHDWLDNANAMRIVVHWTAGGHAASEMEKEHYHYLIEGDGKVVRGKKTPRDNDSTDDKVYAAHTHLLNTGSIGISFCAMRGAVPSNPGDRPITAEQVTAMIEALAELCVHYKIDPLNRKKLLGHSEVQEVYGNRQKEKWDVDWLPHIGYSHERCMQWLRERVAEAMATGKEYLQVPTATLEAATPPKAVEVPEIPEKKQLAIEPVSAGIPAEKEEPHMKKLISDCGGRKFVLSVLGIAGLVLNGKLGLNISPEMMETAANLIMAFVLVEGGGDVMARFRVPTA